MISMRSLLYLAGIISVLVACNKDKLETTPSIKLKGVSTFVVPVNGTLNIVLEYTDKEGDISDTVFVKKIRTNSIKVPTIRDSFPLTVPGFPGNSRGELVLQLQYQNHLVSAINPPSSGGVPPNFHDDTLIFKIALRDQAKHISDTVTTQAIIITR